MSGFPSSSSAQPAQTSHLPREEDDDVTWLDFIRTASRAVAPPLPSHRSESTDRKRPHASSSPERPALPRRVVWTGRRPSHNDSVGHTTPGRSFETPIDLTISPPRSMPQMSRDPSGNEVVRASVRPSIRPTMEGGGRSFSWRSASDTVPPQWQPDSDVDRCPVCRTDFTFFYRKHHCRKCGRVVCAACSPHRITIPRQYIVQPSNTSDGERDPLSPSTSPYRRLGGGEIVRVCNPCVPDPWTPDTAPEELSRSSGDNRRREGPNIYRPLPPPPPLDNNRPRPPPRPSADFSRSLPQGPSTSNWPFQESYTRHPPPPPPDQHRQTGHRYTQSSGNASIQPTSHPRPIRPSAASPISPQTPSHPRPRRVVREEDECPVCGNELPPGENIRETHIQECISARFASTPSSSHPTGRPIRTSSIRTTDNTTTDPDTPTEPSRPRATSYRPRGMAIYRATEKDCLTEEGDPQECVICFEEFQPGDEMGRMECLCKFHRGCIKQWWETKGSGSCPTHMLHE